jgi:hypothetical protein
MASVDTTTAGWSQCALTEQKISRSCQWLSLHEIQDVSCHTGGKQSLSEVNEPKDGMPHYTGSNK